MVGYSGTPLPQKLGIKAGSRLGIIDNPPTFFATLGVLPEGVIVSSRLTGSHDVIVFFTTSRRVLEKRFEALAQAVTPAGALWISWPKKTSGVASDLDENVVRAVGLGRGWVDVKVCAIDETWSGLKFVTRLKNR